MLFPILTKSQVPQVQLSLPEVPVLTERRQVSEGRSLRVRSPDVVQLKSLEEPGAQPNRPWAPQFSQFSRSVVSDSLQPHGLQYTRLPCPSPIPGVYSNSCPLSWWCHPTISSVIPFSSHLQSFRASGSFPMSQLFTSGTQSIGASASVSVLPMNTKDWFPLGLVGSPYSLRDSQQSSPTPQFKSINSSVLSFLYSPTLIGIYDYWKHHSFD